MPTDDAERSSGAWRDAEVQQAAFPLEPVAARASDSVEECSAVVRRLAYFAVYVEPLCALS